MIKIDILNTFKDEIYIKGNIFDLNLDQGEPLEAHILKNYRARGASYLKALKGEFSLIVFDNQNKTLYARSDQLCIIPLYYYQDGSKFYFSNSLIEFKNHFPLEKNPNHFLNIMVENFSDQSGTPYKNIHKLSQGYFLNKSPGKLEIEQYWNPDSAKKLNYKNKQDYIDHFIKLFEQSLMRRVSPATGLFLSGGFDSSSIAYMASRAKLNLSLYSMDFKDSAASEKEPLQKTLEDVNFSNKKVTFEELESDFFKYNSNFDFKGHFYAPNLYIFRPLLEKAKSDQMTTVMTGLGGDDLFNFANAYDYLTKDKNNSTLSQLTLGFFKFENLQRLVLKILPVAIYGKLKKTKQIYLAEKYLDKIKVKNLNVFSALKDFRHSKPIARRIIWNGGYAFGIAQEQALAQAHGLSFSYPLMDVDIVEFVNQLPYEYFFINDMEKPFFREAMKDIVPDAIRCHRSLQDYTRIGIDVVQEQKSDLLRAIKSSYLVTQGIAREDYVSRLSDQSKFTVDDIDILLKVLYSNTY